MKLSFNLKKQEASLEADVEGLVEKGLERREKKPPKKTRYQIRQEEKRKNKELEQKQFVQNLILMGCVLVFILIICVIGATISG